MPIVISKNIILADIVPELYDGPILFKKISQKFAFATPKTTKTKTIANIIIKGIFNIIPSKLDWKLEPGKDLNTYLSVYIAINMPQCDNLIILYKYRWLRISMQSKG